MTAPEIAQITTAFTALLAVVVGPIVTVYVARRQIRASVVSNNRQQWINQLRDTIADLLAKQQMARTLNSNFHSDERSLPRIEDVTRLGYKIQLLINPNESDHATLADSIAKIINSMNMQNEQHSAFDIAKHAEQVLTLSQGILKREWERVKRGD